MRTFLNKLSKIEYGKIKILTPDNKTYKFSGLKDGPNADLKLNSYKSIKKILSNGSLGFAESYLDKDLETTNLKKLLSFSIKNERQLDFIFKKSFFSFITNKIFKKLKENSLNQNKKNISYHYDLGNNFFEKWLDNNLTYSSGIYGSSSNLEAAQINKFKKICSLLKINSKHHLLEIGCGWGSFATFVAKKYKCKVTCITLSKKQFAYVKEKIKKLGLEKRIIVKLIDYRIIDGKFDRIASIEMFEAVGEKYWNLYFKKINQLLKPNGIAALQIITVNNNRYYSYKKNLDFIQKYIFPGGMLPSKNIVKEIILKNMLLASNKSYAKDYVKTLQECLKRFKKSWPKIKVLGFNNKFRRKWEYYLNYCETGFEFGTLDLVQFEIKKRK